MSQLHHGSTISFRARDETMTPTKKPGRWLVPLMLAAALMASVRALGAGAYTWQGQGDAWGAAGNWNPAGGPPQNAGDTATINSGPGVVLNINATLSAFTMNSASASLTIPKSQTLTVNGPATLTQGRVFLTGGTIAGSGTLTIGAKSIVAVQGSGTSTIQNPISLSGTLSLQSPGGKTDNGIALSLAQDLTNNGTIKFLNRIPASADDDAQVVLTINGGKGKLTNSRTISFSSTSVSASGISASVVNNAGANITLEASRDPKRQGNDAFLGSAGAKSSNLGTITIGAGASLSLIGASFVNDKNGANTGKIVGAGELDRSEIPKGGWTNNGDVTVAKVYPPLAQANPNMPQGQGLAQAGLQPGLLTFVGDYVQSASGTLGIAINQGGSAGTDYSQLAITQGAAYLDGALDVTLNNPGAITSGDVFTVLTADSGLFGSFANAPADASDMSTLVTSGGTFEVLYLRSLGGPSAVELTDFVPDGGGVLGLASVPEPPGLVLGSVALVGGLSYVWTVARRRPRRLRVRTAIPRRWGPSSGTRASAFFPGGDG
jgi:filamentous hemagglutinin